MGGFLYHLLGHVPEEGEAADFDGHRLVAQKVDGRRIAQVLIGVSAPRAPPRRRSPSPTGPKNSLDEPQHGWRPGPWLPLRDRGYRGQG